MRATLSCSELSAVAWGTSRGGHQPWQQGDIGHIGKGLPNAGSARQRQKPPHRRLSGHKQQCPPGRTKDLQQGSHQKNPPPLEPIHHHAAGKGQQKQRRQHQKGVQPQIPGAARGFIDEPRLGGVLHPGADIRQQGRAQQPRQRTMLQHLPTSPRGRVLLLRPQQVLHQLRVKGPKVGGVVDVAHGRRLSGIRIPETRITG
jgi:hypothetical protein